MLTETEGVLLGVGVGRPGPIGGSEQEASRATAPIKAGSTAARGRGKTDRPHPTTMNRAYRPNP
ncbi:hypothetical protein GCM10028864_30010 [Microlunatus parietis]